MSKFAKSLAVLSAALVGAATLASEPPDSAVNPQDGTIATVETVVDGEDTGIRVSLDPGTGAPTNTIDLTTESEDDRGPRVEIASSGDLWVVWSREESTAGVRVRKRAYATGEWGDDLLASEANEASRNADLALDGATPWVAYELEKDSGSQIAVVAIEDEPVPIGQRTILGETYFSGALDVKVHVAGGELWVTWVNDEAEVGWSVYDRGTETWSAADYESYEEDSVAEARARIASAVTGN